MVFHIKVSGEKVIKNVTQMVLYDVATEAVVFRSRPFDNIRYQKDKEKDEKKAKESLQVQFDKMFDEVDKSSKKYKLGKLPAGLTAERVSQHMESKVEQRKYKSKLRTLAEIRFYNYNQLIDKPRTEALYSAILGPKAGKTLASGAPKAREKAIESLLPKTGAGGRPAPPKKAFR